MTVLIIGASNKVDRFSYKAFSLLKQKGYSLVLMHPILSSIDDHPVLSTFSDITEPIDTVTLYINTQASSNIHDDLIALAPRRVIFNPGAENSDLMEDLQAVGIDCVEACSLVLLNIGRF
jgi:uncharacterized protein